MALQGPSLSCCIAATVNYVLTQMQNPWGFSLSCVDRQVTALQPESIALLGACAAAKSMCISLAHFSWATQHVYIAIHFEACASSHPSIACQLWQLSQPCVMHEGSGLGHERDPARETRARPETFLTIARNTIAHKVTMSQCQVSLWGSSLSSCMQCLDCPTVIERHMCCSNASCC